MSSEKLTSAKRRKGTGSQASLGMDHPMEMSSRPASAHSRSAWSAENDVTDDIDFSPRATATAVDVSPTGMEAEPVSHQKQIAADTRAGGDERNVPVGCWTRFKRIVRSLWRTRQTEDVDCDRELHVKTTLRELVIYIFFIVVLCILTFGMTSSTMYYFTKVMKDLFVETTMENRNTFKDITTMNEFFMYSTGPLFNGIYWEQYYNGNNVTHKNLKEGELGYIYFENKILGRPRLRQMRVKNDSCVVHDDFSNVIKQCYAPYSSAVEDKSPFGKQNGTAWVFQSEEELNGRSYWGQLATYKGGGFTQLLEPTKNKSLEIMKDLKANLWLDRGTRAVFIDFSVYNANINLFCIVRLLFEYPATGGCIPSYNFRTLKLIRYVTSFDHFVMACEGIFLIFLVYYTIEEFIEIKKHKLQYFKSFWNVLDVVVLLLGYVAVIFHIYRTIVVSNLLEDLLDEPNQYANFDNLGFWQTQFNNNVAIAVFFSWIKVFKYISFNKTMTQLSSTLAKCAKDVAGFAVMFFIIFFAYAQLGYLIFGTQVRDFSTFGNSIFTLFRIILGDFDFHQIESANRILGPMFFITYVFFVFFVLLNMFLAIINDTYAEVKSDIAQQKSEFEIGDYFKKGYQKVVDKLSLKREKIADIQKALQNADINQDSKLDFEEWRAELKSRGHADAEIEAVFAKYDVDGDRILDENECKKMQEDLEGQKAELNEEIEEIERAKEEGRPGTAASRISIRDSDMDSDDDFGGLHGRSDSPTPRRRGGGGRGGVSQEDFNVLTRRVDRMEHSIGSIVSKIDAVLVKLEAMEKAKLKRRETMAKLLDSITEGTNSKSEEDLKRDQMEKLVREELDRWNSDGSLRSGAPDSRPASATGGSRQGSRAPTARSMYSQAGKASAASRGRKTAQGSTSSLRMQADDGISQPFHEHSQV